MVRRLILLAILLLLILFSTSANFAGVDGSRDVMPVPQISPWILTPGQYIRMAWNAIAHPDELPAAECSDFIRYLPAETSQPIAHVEIPQHPFMAANWGNNMHCDSYISDAYEASGPVGLNAEVSSRTQGFGGYGTITFDQQGRLVAVYSNGRGFQLELMDPSSLRELASHNLPSRPWYWLLQGIMPWQYIGAGMYFFLDDQDRAIVPTTKNTIQVIQTPDAGGEFELVREYDLDEYVVPMRWPHRDSVAWVLPDWGGTVYWWATTGGVVGTVDVASGEVHTLRLEDEIIENSFAVGEDGTFILSDRALYRFNLSHTGDIVVDWRIDYDRGPSKKPGHITRGSGTSVTLMGGLDGLVAFTDNAEPRIHLTFVKRSDGSLACSIPVFEDGKSGTDISVAGFEHADTDGEGTGVYSALIENNWGHHRFPRSFPEPGLTRVDVIRHPDGSYTCEQIWRSGEKGIGVFKLSFGSGLAYMYWRSESCPVTSWYLTAVDFATGDTVYKKLVGKGLGYNNWAGALFLHPDGGIAYSTTIFGLVMIRDTGP
ncbi:hypothetical protein ACFLSW_00015 [Candidatus Bipolaricaulota bacterium]